MAFLLQECIYSAIKVLDFLKPVFPLGGIHPIFNSLLVEFRT